MGNKVKVYINSREYIIESDESVEYTKSLAKKLSDRIGAAMRGTSISFVDAAILVSLDCLDETTKQGANMDNIRAQVKDYVDDAGQARLKLDEAQRELRSAKAKIASLEKDLASKTAQLETKNKEIELKQKMYESAKAQVDSLIAEKAKTPSYSTYGSSATTAATTSTATAATTSASTTSGYTSSYTQKSSGFNFYDPAKSATATTTTATPSATSATVAPKPATTSGSTISYTTNDPTKKY